MSDALAALRSPELVAAREAHFDRLRRLFAGQRLDAPFYLCGINGTSQADPYGEPERWVEEALRSLAEQADRLRDSVVFRPLCLEFGPWGVHFVDRMLGAHVYEHAGQWWSGCLNTSMGKLEPPDLDGDETWTREPQLTP